MVTDFGIVIFVNPLQYAKASFLIAITDCGIVIFVNEPQYLKQPEGISVILLDNWTSVNYLQLYKIGPFIVVTVSGITMRSRFMVL